MNNLKENIKKITPADGSVSDWKESAIYTQNNLWMDYSEHIARRVYALIKGDKKINQEKLAAALGVKPQYISRILKGQENLTLKTIYKLSKALNFELITFPTYEFTQTIKVENNWQATATIEGNGKVVSLTAFEYRKFK